MPRTHSLRSAHVCLVQRNLMLPACRLELSYLSLPCHPSPLSRNFPTGIREWIFVVLAFRRFEPLVRSWSASTVRLWVFAFCHKSGMVYLPKAHWSLDTLRRQSPCQSAAHDEHSTACCCAGSGRFARPATTACTCCNVQESQKPSNRFKFFFDPAMFTSFPSNNIAMRCMMSIGNDQLLFTAFC